MSIVNVILERYSVRSYQDRPVEEEKLLRILEAGRLAPSARNIQEWRFVVVTNPGLRSRLSEAANHQKFVAQAPVVIVCCSVVTDYTMRCGQLAYPIDCAIAIDHMTLQAVQEGLGTCWIGAFYPDQVRPVLNIPDHVSVVEMLALGYASGTRTATVSRRPLENLYSMNAWNASLEA